MVEEKNQVSIKCGECDVIIGEDEQGRPTLTPFCSPGENRNPKLSDEAKALKEAFQSEEVVLKPVKIK